MRKKILGTLATLAVLVAGLAVVVALQPSEFRVQRAATIEAPAADVFAQVNDLRAWDAWSPWAKLDPEARHGFEGPAAGKGAVITWSGNDEIGEGRMTITDSRPAERVRLRLEFVRPFESACDVQFTFQPRGEQTEVTWTMSGQNNFIAKAMCLVMDMDKMCGGQFEQGLARMKAVAEAKAKKESAAVR